MNDKIREFFEHHEGRRKDVYKDSRGFRTVGIGHLLDHEQSPDELSVLGCRQNEVHLIISVNDAQIDGLFDIDYMEACDDARVIFGDQFETFSEVRQTVIVSQCFQLGFTGFRKFKNMIAAMKAEDWERAARESLDSRAARQTPERWKQQADMLKYNTWDGNPKTSDASQESDISVADLQASLSTLSARVEALEKQVFNQKKRPPFSP